MGANASSAAIQARMEEHLDFAQDKAAVAAFEASEAGQAAAGETFAAIAAETGITDKGGYAALTKECGFGVRDPLAQSFFVGAPVYITKVDLYFGS